MPTRTAMRQLALAMAMALAGSETSFADGKFFGVSTIERDPTIQSQRAIITYRDGVQTLLVESIVDDDGEEVAWILPLPAEPTSIEAATPGTIETMAQLIQPEITAAYETKGGASLALWVLIASVVFTSLFWLLARKVPVRTAFWTAMPVPLFLLLCPALLLPALATARGGVDVGGIEVVSSQRVGSYDVEIIRGDEPTVVVDWLSAGGFAMPDAAIPVIADYVKDGWVFAAIRLAHEPGVPFAPHPLRVEFEVDDPVYPMRLTGVTDEPLRLDLYVIADGNAACDDLDLWFAESFLPSQHHVLNVYETSVFRSVHTAIGHPALIDLMWSGCVISHLTANLTPAQMQRDFVIEIAPRREYRAHFYAKQSALHVGAIIAMLLTAITLPIAAVWGRARELPEPTIVYRRILPALATWCAAGVIAWLSIPTQTVSTTHPMHAQAAMYQFRQGIMTLGAEATRITNLDSSFEEMFSPDLLETMREGMDSATGYTVDAAGDGWVVTIYDRFATPLRLLVPAEGEVIELDALDQLEPAGGDVEEGGGTPNVAHAHS